MAVTNTTVLAGTSTFIFDIAATADADVTTGNVAHGLGAIPLDISGVQTLSQAIGALSAWAVTTVDITNVVCTKLATVGSGSATKQYRVRVSLPHSIVR